MKKLIIAVYLLIITQSIYSYEPEWALYGVPTSCKFNSGLSVYSEKKEVNGVNKYFYGAINTCGNVAITPQFERLSDFENGVAIAEIGGKEGVINTRGVFLAEPVLKSVRRIKEVEGAYELTSENGKHGLFYNGRVVIPTKYDDISMQYPFVNCSNWKNNKEKISLNLLNGECLEFVLMQADILVGRNQDGNNVYMDLKGVRVDSIKLTQSSKGVKIYKDKNSNKYGLMDINSGEIVVPCKYEQMQGIWINDLIIATDSINDKQNTQILINSEGKELIRDNTKDLVIMYVGDYIQVSYYEISGDYKSYIVGLYDLNGDAILPLNGDKNVLFKLKYGKDYFMIQDKNSGESYLYNAKLRKIYEQGNPNYENIVDDMIPVSNSSGGWFYVNGKTGNVIGKYKYLNPFSEGVARVRRYGSSYDDIIDKNGRVLLYGSKAMTFDSDCSEGVIGVTEEKQDDTGYATTRVKGYIYNPLGHNGFVYNQQKYTNSAFDAWRLKANEAMEKKDNAKAMEYCYLLMVNDPDAQVLANYATCLLNMQYFDEAIEAYLMSLDMDPDYTFAKNGLAIARDNKKIYEEQKKTIADETENNNKSNTFWDALSSICAAICDVNMTGNNYGYVNTSSQMLLDSDGVSVASNTDYQGQYDAWARRAEKNYNSLVNLGYSYKDSFGNKSGGTNQSLSNSNYVRQKKYLRDAQREMRNIRQKANRNGVKIVQSKWETATVSY